MYKEVIVQQNKNILMCQSIVMLINIMRHPVSSDSATSNLNVAFKFQINFHYVNKLL